MTAPEQIEVKPLIEGLVAILTGQDSNLNKQLLLNLACDFLIDDVEGIWTRSDTMNQALKARANELRELKNQLRPEFKIGDQNDYA